MWGLHELLDRWSCDPNVSRLSPSSAEVKLMTRKTSDGSDAALDSALDAGTYKLKDSMYTVEMFSHLASLCLLRGSRERHVEVGTSRSE